MNNTLEEVLKFANENPTSWLATAEDDQPYVRGMWMWFADETGFYYHTARAKRMCGHIAKNSKVAAAFIKDSDKPTFSTLHVEGIMEEVKDKDLMDRLLKERSWLQDNINKSGVETEVVIYRIAHGVAYIWDMSWNVNEKNIPRIKF